jgi:hypothetical protein
MISPDDARHPPVKSAVTVVDGHQHHRRRDRRGDEQQKRVRRVARQVVVSGRPLPIAAVDREVADVGTHHRCPRAAHHPGPNQAAEKEEPAHQREHECAPEDTGHRLTGSRHAERTADVDELADEEHQRHGEEELNEPDLDELRYPTADPVEGQHPPPDEPQHPHGPEH